MFRINQINPNENDLSVPLNVYVLLLCFHLCTNILPERLSMLTFSPFYSWYIIADIVVIWTIMDDWYTYQYNYSMILTADIKHIEFYQVLIILLAGGGTCSEGGSVSEAVLELTHLDSCWRHQMEPFSALVAICAGNSPVTGEFPAQRPATRRFDVFFDLRVNVRLSKQLWGWWFETPSHQLWRHCNVHCYCIPVYYCYFLKALNG